MHYPNNANKKYKKKECWFDGLIQELLITGVPNLAAPLPVTIIQSIENGKFPAFCKEAYVSNPGTSKGDRAKRKLKVSCVVLRQLS